ncbi:hypothetical protein [Streptomyces sp. NPDC020996]|uniref:hypothetical protein n=1 Tax=Streptomyces sp. NPDC020996 TaxID=3154791 RepID=UPI0033EB7DA9
MSEIAGQTGFRRAATAVVHESYSFACMRCGQGWEQSYEIEHHTDADGQEFVMYVADGEVVPSPLSRPTCFNCDSHVVRIMRAGQVSSVRDAVHRHRTVPQAGPVEAPRVPVAETAQAAQASVAAARAAEAVAAAGGAGAGERRHWQLSDLLHPFHRRAS